MKKARIIGTGSYLPKRILSNSDLEKMVDTSDEWIVSRTGIKERRIAAKDEYPSDMGTNAAKKALVSSGITAEKVGMIIVATMTGDYISPSTAALIQHNIGAVNAAAMDIQAACSGYLYCLSIAKAYVESGMYRHVLVVATEKMSAVMDYKDRNTCVLFGDGAAASVVSQTGPGLSIAAVCLGAEGELADLIAVPGGGSRHPASQQMLTEGLQYFKMSGKEVFKHAVRRMGAAAKESLVQAGLTESDISWIVPHQANMRIMDAISKSFNIPDEQIYKTIEKYGNTSASSIPIALDELLHKKEIKIGQNILLVAFGGGLTWGAAILTKIK